uniref:Uncharacterized protein n=1 Tax=Arundo donax TaxID=35708 RepID=A0A0A9GVI4_ARUDO
MATYSVWCVDILQCQYISGFIYDILLLHILTIFHLELLLKDLIYAQNQIISSVLMQI